jgi:hypothetical protein
MGLIREFYSSQTIMTRIEMKVRVESQRRKICEQLEGEEFG